MEICSIPDDLGIQRPIEYYMQRIGRMYAYGSMYVPRIKAAGVHTNSWMLLARTQPSALAAAVAVIRGARGAAPH